MNEYVGRMVRLLRTFSTKGGAEFKSGETVECRGHHQGRLFLVAPGAGGTGRCASRVPRTWVELVAEPNP